MCLGCCDHTSVVWSISCPGRMQCMPSSSVTYQQRANASKIGSSSSRGGRGMEGEKER